MATEPGYRGIPRQCHHETCDHFFEYHCTEDCKVDQDLSVGQNRSTQEAGETNGEPVSADITNPKNAYLIGALGGELAKQGVTTTPVTDNDGYTNELELRFQFMDRLVKARIRVEEIDFDSETWF